MATIAQKVAGLALVLTGYKEFNDGLKQSGEAIGKFNDAIAASQTTTISAPIEKAGVALTEFGDKWRALSEYFTGQKPPILDNEAWNRIGAAMEDASNKGIQSTTALAAAIAEEVQKAKDLEEETKRLADAQAKAAAQAEAYNAALDASGKAMLSLGKASATALIGIGMVASRIDELNNILDITARNSAELREEEAAMAEVAGDLRLQEERLGQVALLTSNSVAKEVEEVRKLHLSGIVANEAVAQMIRYDLDWTKANELAREAQDAATFAMQDSSVAMNGLIQGIITLQPRLLRTYGIMINLDIAYEKFAQANGVAVKEMTVTQRQQAALNEVLAKAPSIAGAYEAAMGTASKRVRSLKTDSINLAEAYGQFVTPTLDAATGALRSVILGLTDLSPEIRGTIVDLAQWGTGFLLLGGAALKARSALVALTAIDIETGLSKLGRATQFLATNWQLLVAGLAVGAIVTAVAAVKNVEKAHIAEATATVEATDTYQQYKIALDDSGISVYALTRGLYELVKAQEIATQAEFARQLLESQRALKALVIALDPATMVLRGFNTEGEATETALTDMQLRVLTDRDAVLILGTAIGKSGKQLEDWTTAVIAGAQATLIARNATRDYNQFERDRYKIILDTMQVEEAHSSLLYETTRQLKQYEKGLRDASIAQIQLNQAISMQEEIDKNVEDAAWSLLNAQHQNILALEDLDYDYAQKRQDIWEEMNKELAEIDAQLADIHANILDELIDLDEDYALKRERAYEDMQQALADAEEDLIHDQEDKRRDYYFDLEDAEREHNQNLEDINRDYQEDLLDIEEEYAQKRADLEADFSEEQSDIREKYKEARIRELVRMGYDEQQIRENWNDDMMQGPLEEAMNEELAALQENYDEELSDLELALQREKEEREEALQQQIRDEEERYAEWREERQRNYQRDLEDLQIKHQREEEEIARAYQRKLEDLAIQYEREREEILEKLEQQRQDILKKYAEQADDLDKWYADRKKEIAREYEKQRTEIAYQLDLSNLKASEKFGLLPGMFQPTWDALILQATTSMGAWSQAIITGIQSVFDALGAHSPSSVLQDLGESISGGLTIGLQKGALGNYSAGTNVLPAMAGMTTNRNSNVNLNMPTTVNNGMDAAIFQQMVLQTVTRALRYG